MRLKYIFVSPVIMSGRCKELLDQEFFVIKGNVLCYSMPCTLNIHEIHFLFTLLLLLHEKGVMICPFSIVMLYTCFLKLFSKISHVKQVFREDDFE